VLERLRLPLTSSYHFFLLKVAVTLLAASSVTVQVPVPLQAPLQPENVERQAGLAVRVTAVFALYEVPQVLPQLMPAGIDVTVPPPVPLLETERV
jgi:hypothetical protein